MCLLVPVVSAAVLVFFGYIALWSAHQSNTPAGVSQFGRIMSIILFVFAGLVLVAGVAHRHHRGMQCGMEKMSCCEGVPCTQDQTWHRGFGEMRGMDKQRLPFEKEQPGAPAPEEKNGKK